MSLATMKVKVSEALASSAAAAQRAKRGASAAAPPMRKASRRWYLRGGGWIIRRFQRWTVRLYRSPEPESNGFGREMAEITKHGLTSGGGSCPMVDNGRLRFFCRGGQFDAVL